MSDQSPRRRFIAGSLSGLLAVFPGAALLNRRTIPGTLAHDEWLEGLTGKHRQFFDVGSIQAGAPLRRVSNFLDTYVSAYQLRHSEVNAVVGVHGKALPFTFNDAAWAKYEFGALYEVVDPKTGTLSTRNVFWDVEPDAGPIRPEASIRQLQSRGGRFLACNNTMMSLSAELAGRRGENPADVRRYLLACLLPGITVVPAMLIAGNRAQEAGLTYAALG